MDEITRNMGIFGDRCPRCWVENRDQNTMRVLHISRVHDWAAPSGHNGNVESSVEWCPACGTVRHCIDYKPDGGVHVYVVGEEGA